MFSLKCTWRLHWVFENLVIYIKSTKIFESFFTNFPFVCLSVLICLVVFGCNVQNITFKPESFSCKLYFIIFSLLRFFWIPAFTLIH